MLKKKTKIKKCLNHLKIERHTPITSSIYSIRQPLKNKKKQKQCSI